MWIKIGIQELGGLTMLAYRSLIALFVLVGVLLYRRSKIIQLRNWWIFFMLGFFNIVLPIGLISWSEQYISTGLASILNSLVPIFTIMFSQMFLSDERITRQGVAGVLVSFGGVVVLMAKKNQGMDMQLVGEIAMLVAVSSFAIGNVTSRRFGRGVTPEVLAFGQQIMACIQLYPLVMIFEAPFVIPKMPMTWLAVVWTGILNTGLGTIIYYSLINSVGPTRTSLVTYIYPLVGVLLGLIFLDEILTWRIVAGGLLIIGGIVVVNFISRQPAVEKAAIVDT